MFPKHMLMQSLSAPGCDMIVTKITLNTLDVYRLNVVLQVPLLFKGFVAYNTRVASDIASFEAWHGL